MSRDPARRAGRADAVQLLHRLRRHRVAPVDDLGRQRIGGPRLRLLLVGHRHHPQREDLVDLGGVVERTFALLGDLGVVVEDDRRDQQEVVVHRPPGQHWEAPVLAAARQRPPPRRGARAARRTRRRRLRRSRGCRSSTWRSRRPCRCARGQPVLRDREHDAAGTVVCGVRCETVSSAGDRRLGSDEPADPSTSLVASCPRRRHLDRHACVSGAVSPNGPKDDSRSTASSQRRPRRRRPLVNSSTGSKRPPPACVRRGGAAVAGTAPR